MRRTAPLVAALVLIFGCGEQAEPETIRVDGSSVAREDLRRAAASLCIARDRAESEDLDGARTVFQDRAHHHLHTLADALEDVDRDGTADLLRAKRRVENDLEEGDVAELRLHLLELIDAAEAGLAKLSIAPRRCP